MFSQFGAGIVDTDVVAREVVALGEPGLAAVKEAFGDDVLLDNGELDRRALREAVFRDEAARRRLESILHPLIRERTLAQIESLDAPYALIVVPLLIETSFNEIVDRVLVVDCPREVQIDRLMRRDGISLAEAEAMLAAQSSRDARNALADDVIDGSLSLDRVRDRCGLLHTKYLELAAGAFDG